MAHAVGKEATAKRYDDVVQNIRASFQKAYIKDDEEVGTGAQTSYVVALYSYNHYAFGSVIAWVYHYAAGMDTLPGAPGFKEIIVHPHLDARMTSARAEYESIYGKIISDWKGTPAGPFSLNVTIPANTSGRVFLPTIAGAHLTEDGNSVEARTEKDRI